MLTDSEQRLVNIISLAAHEGRLAIGDGHDPEGRRKVFLCAVRDDAPPLFICEIRPENAELVIAHS